ncbi:MAG: nucleotide exchange factor GrpE [Clostridia bacterium]|nr:nucleotide exchange factor GrpE [Clostridia bacterium]
MNKEKTTENTEELEQETVEETTEGAEVEEVEEKDPLAELNEQYLRLAAEYDNYKRRTTQEKVQIYTNSVAEVIEKILPFVDNMARATAVEVASEDAKQLLEGIKLVERQFLETLTAIGVEEIKAEGEKFDPNMHNAVMHVDDDSIEGEEIVVEEFIKGYKYKDKVIRHSTVKVAN